MRALVLLLLASCVACSEAPVATEVLVLIDAEPTLAAMLVRLQVDIYDGPSLDSAMQAFPILLGDGNKQYRMPLSFSIAARNQQDSRQFRVVVTGFDAAQEARVEQQVITSFHPDAAGRLDLYLYSGCSDLCRVNGQRGVQTCNRFGVCEDVPVITNLPAATPEALGGYTSVGHGQTDSGVIVLDQDSGPPPDARAAEPGNDAAPQLDSSVRLDGGASSQDSAAPGPDGSGAPADSGGSSADAASDARANDAVAPVDASADADARVSVDARADADASDAATYAFNPIVPTPNGTCPSLVSGALTVMGLSVEVQAGAVGSTKGALLFYWHGTGNSAGEVNSNGIGGVPPAVRSEILAGGGMIVSGGITTGSGSDTSGTGTWYSADLPAMDQITACAVRDYNIDPRRVYSTGCSSGAIHASGMAFSRASYLAAVTSNSGGLQFSGSGVVQAGAPRMTPVMAMYGGDSDKVIVSFSETSALFTTEAKLRGGLAVSCNHDMGHCRAPTALLTAAWQFMKDHPYGVTPEPYTATLPASFPSYCVK